jgi:hypothetical protein
LWRFSTTLYVSCWCHIRPFDLQELPGDNEAKDSSEEEDKEDSDDENFVDAKPETASGLWASGHAKPETASKDAGDAPSKEKRPETTADPAVSVAKLGHPLPPLPSGSAASFCPPGAAVQVSHDPRQITFP